MHDVACEFRAQQGCAETISADVLKDAGGFTCDQRKFIREVSKVRIISKHAFGMAKGRRVFT